MIIAILFHEFIMGTAFYDLPLMDDIDHVGVLDGGQAVGNGNSGPGLHQFEKRILHKTLALGVESGSGLIKNEDGRIFNMARAMLIRCR